MRNTFGHLYTLTTFGESHGEAVGGVIDGMRNYRSSAQLTVSIDGERTMVGFAASF